MIPNVLAMGVIVSVAAVAAAHMSVRAYLVVLGGFALVWIFASQALTERDPGALVVLLFLLAAGLAVAACVQLVRMLFRDRAMSRLLITCVALVGSSLATGFLYLLFAS